VNKQSESNIPTRQLLIDYFNIFNEIFFFGTLTEELCELTFVPAKWNMWIRKKLGENDEGYATDRRNRLKRRDEAHAKIYIYELLAQRNKAKLLHK
jgi:hypothetical protein